MSNFFLFWNKVNLNFLCVFYEKKHMTKVVYMLPPIVLFTNIIYDNINTENSEWSKIIQIMSNIENLQVLNNE